MGMDFKMLNALSNEKLLAYKEQFKGQPSVSQLIDGILTSRTALEAEADKSIGQALQAQADLDNYEQKLLKGIKTMPKDVPAGLQNILYRRVAMPSKDKDGKDIEEMMWGVEINHACKKSFDKDGKQEPNKSIGKLAVRIFEQISQPMLEADGKPKKDSAGQPVIQVIEKDLGEWASMRAFATSIGIENHGASAKQDLANNTLGRRFRVQNLS